MVFISAKENVLATTKLFGNKIRGSRSACNCVSTGNDMGEVEGGNDMGEVEGGLRLLKFIILSQKAFFSTGSSIGLRVDHGEVVVVVVVLFSQRGRNDIKRIYFMKLS
jgi:hypothetical protein